jgi:hypothetical protein
MLTYADTLLCTPGGHEAMLAAYREAARVLSLLALLVQTYKY